MDFWRLVGCRWGFVSTRDSFKMIGFLTCHVDVIRQIYKSGQIITTNSRRLVTLNGGEKGSVPQIPLIHF